MASISTLINRLLGKAEASSKTTAKDRLLVVIKHDRTDIPAPILEAFRDRMEALCNEFFEMDESALDVSLERGEDGYALVASIPVRRVRKEPTTAATAGTVVRTP